MFFVAVLVWRVCFAVFVTGLRAISDFIMIVITYCCSFCCSVAVVFVLREVLRLGHCAESLDATMLRANVPAAYGTCAESHDVLMSNAERYLFGRCKIHSQTPCCLWYALHVAHRRPDHDVE